MPTSKTYRILSGYCPDEKCQAKLFFPSYDSSIECTNCGQRHEQRVLNKLEEVKDPNVALHNMIRTVLLGNTIPKKGTEMVKLLGLSNYHCKLLSSILTYYGMDRKTGKAYLLKDMNQGEIFDCSILGDRAFLIDPDHISVVGYGRDISGSAQYLADTLKIIQAYNKGEDTLIPIHADGDGHCLVHAVSRALVGRELFWHPLRTNLKCHFQKNLNKYKEMFKEFIDPLEWQLIIDECDPDFQPPDGELLGLRNIHVFGLANVLRRPIILLDSLTGMQSSGDYSALFLPGLIDPRDCKGKTGELHKPLCIAWSSSSRNHYIPLVGIKHDSLPLLPRHLLPTPWGLSASLVNKYVEFNENDCCIIGGDKCLQDSYILRLASAMEEVFINQHKVHPALVADVHHYVFKRTGVVGVQPKEILQATQSAVQEYRLYRCLTCDAVCEQTVVDEWLRPGGALYNLAEQKHGKLRVDKLYSFPLQGITCNYNPEVDELVPDMKNAVLEKCCWCHGSNVRLINGDNTVQYRNGDHTKSRAKSNYCNCGFKHFWDSKEYDNLPQLIPVTLEWGGKVVGEKVAWFQNESDPSLNSNVYDIANKLIQKHFPGVFGIERLAQKVVDQILEQTKKPEDPKTAPHSEHVASKEDLPSKIIISGFNTLHKEELNMSETEKMIRQKIEVHAAQKQRRMTYKPETSSSKLPITKSVSPKHHEKRSSPNSSPQQKHEERITSKSPATIPQARMIRISVTDGRQLCLPLESVHTLYDLQHILETKLNIPSSRQRILHGFPPRELSLASLGKDMNLPFQHSNRITVEVLPETKFPLSDVGQDVSLNMPLNTNEESKVAETLQNTLQDMQNSNLENLDSALISLMLSATLNGQNIWPHVQNLPQLFAKGGLFYLQMERDVGLVDGKHCRLSLLPDKVFRYNQAQDRLELCAEPLGHFPIEHGIDDYVAELKKCKKALPDVPTGTPSRKFSGTSGVIVSKSTEILASHVPFQGQGHILSGKAFPSSSGIVDYGFDDNMEVGEPCSDLNKEDQTSKFSSKPTSLIRKGPGYSILNPEVANITNQNVAKLNSFAHIIEGILDVIELKCEDGMQTSVSVENDILMSENQLEKAEVGEPLDVVPSTSFQEQPLIQSSSFLENHDMLDQVEMIQVTSVNDDNMLKKDADNKSEDPMDI